MRRLKLPRARSFEVRFLDNLVKLVDTNGKELGRLNIRYNPDAKLLVVSPKSVRSGYSMEVG